jgi:hypothetical protein
MAESQDSQEYHQEEASILRKKIIMALRMLKVKGMGLMMVPK